MAEHESAVYDFLNELRMTQAVSDPIYERAVAAFGETGVVDLIALAGYYGTLAMILNVARTPLPPGKAPLLPALRAKKGRRSIGR